MLLEKKSFLHFVFLYTKFLKNDILCFQYERDESIYSPGKRDGI